VNSISAVPISRIQHLEISRSWLAIKFELATLKIFTAGESGIDLSIDGLNYNEAKQINDFLSRKVNGTN
jgi:membrane protein YdbS with pleckstrin-like domain